MKSEFGKARLTIGTTGENSQYRRAQSVKSKNLHFQARLCQKCNNHTTQKPDRAFDELHRQVREIFEQGRDPIEILDREEFQEHTVNRTYIFRYFAKLLACQLADMGAPVQLEICDFATGKSGFNPINLQIKADATYKKTSSQIPDFQYASHGGVVVSGNKKTLFPSAFYSTLSIGPVQYCYHAQLIFLGQIRLFIDHPKFFLWCRSAVKKAVKSPLTGDELEALGLDT